MEIKINATGVRARLDFTAAELDTLVEALGATISDYDYEGVDGDMADEKRLRERLAKDAAALNEFQMTGTIGGVGGFSS